jgi:hypothetical protein
VTSSSRRADRVARGVAAAPGRAATGGRDAEDDVPPAEIARHWDAAHRPEQALGPTIRAAEAAERVYAFPEAGRLWARAGTLASEAPAAGVALGLTRDVLLGRAADAAVLAGDYRDAIELGEAAVALVDPAADPLRAGHLHDRLRWSSASTAPIELMARTCLSSSDRATSRM